MQLILSFLLFFQTATVAPITLAWDDSSPAGVTQWFNVYRATDINGPWVRVNGQNIPVDTPTYTDTVPVGQTYFWVVTAANEDNESDHSNTVTWRAVRPKPNAPINNRKIN